MDLIKKTDNKNKKFCGNSTLELPLLGFEIE